MPRIQTLLGGLLCILVYCLFILASLYFGQDAFKLLKGDNKEFLLVKDATHCDLYDGGINHDKIPFDKIEEFIKKNI